jgi:hypothetical protein
MSLLLRSGVDSLLLLLGTSQEHVKSM